MEANMRDTFVFRESDASEEVAFRGCSSWDLETCLEDVEGLHFAWTHEKAIDYAIPEGYTELGYVVEVSPFHLYMTGATMHHGQQWVTYSDFKIEGQDQPVVWDLLVKMVVDWKSAIERGEVQTAAPETVHERTFATYLETKRWKLPDADTRKLLDTAGQQRCPEWNDEEQVDLLENWKRMVHAAVRAAPWNYPGPSDEFVADGGDVYKCVRKITEFKLKKKKEKKRKRKENDHTEEVVYPMNSSIPLSPLGTPAAETEFTSWLRVTAAE